MSREDRIRALAYRFWEWAGRPEGRALGMWVLAEKFFCPEYAATHHWPPQDGA